MRKSLLFVFPVVPYPARLNGISVRYAPILEHLRQQYDIHVAIITNNAEPLPSLTELDDLCNSVQVHYRDREMKTPFLKKVARRIGSLLTAYRPHLLQYHDEQHIEEFLVNEVSAVRPSRPFDAIVWVTAAHLDIGLRVFGGSRLIFDAIDSIYLNQLRVAGNNLLAKLDLWRLAQWERNIVNEVQSTIYISPIDAGASLGALSNPKIKIIPNGVYTGDVAASGEAPAADRITIGFIGHMGYAPNILATLRLAKIFHQLEQADPRFHLLIIGRSPAPEILALQSAKITITGTVDNIWPYIRQVDLFVFPMLSGAGQQNKVLEALYAGKAVICNATANGGIGAASGKHLQLCETDDEFADAVANLANDPAQARSLASEGQRFVMENYSWDSILPRYEALLTSVWRV